METVNGVVERITFYNEENGYTVLRLSPDGHYPEAQARDGTIAVVGVMPELGEGESIQVTGQWVDDPRYGRQLKVETVIPLAPVTREGIVRYLSSGIVSGIGPKTAERIVDHFGDETLHILDLTPERIDEVPGLRPELAQKLKSAWKDNRSMRQTLIYLQGYGISSRLAQKIYAEYGDETISIVQNDPYQLAADVFGIGFKKADAIARSMGLAPDAPGRLRAGLAYALSQLALDGHTYAPREVLLHTACDLLEVEDKARLAVALDGQIAAGNLKEDILILASGERQQAVYLPMYFYAERGAASLLNALARTKSKIIMQSEKIRWPAFLEALAKQSNLTLTPQQQSAVKAAFTSKVSVLTGGPGTGKTTTLQMVIHALEEGEYRYALASPTGRAAKRLSEATDRGARTIHRLLEFNPMEGGFQRDESNPLEVDLVVVDEASMLDVLLFYNLLKALLATTHLLLVGDVDQLPSVGAGNVLRDIIDSGVAHVTRLDQIFRQSDDSYIIVNAHRVNQGEMPYTDNRGEDFFFFSESDPQTAADLLVDVVYKRLPQKFGYDPMNDIQVIAPMYRGPIGVHALNRALQQKLNGDRRMAEKLLNGTLFRVGDKVMQTRNNYEKEVFNGDIGRIYGIDLEENQLEVVIDGRYLYYDWGNEVDQLILAYCISTHRSQGSEYPVVVMPIMPQHYMMLQRNLLYTAITRAKEVVVLVGERKAIGMAVRNNKVAERFSGLLERLRR